MYTCVFVSIMSSNFIVKVREYMSVVFHLADGCCMLYILVYSMYSNVCAHVVFLLMFFYFLFIFFCFYGFLN